MFTSFTSSHAHEASMILTWTSFPHTQYIKRGRIKDDTHHHGVIECLRSTAQIQAYICNPYKDPETTRFRTASWATYHASATISLSHVTDWFYVEEEKKRRDINNKLILLPLCNLSMLLQTCNTHAMLQHLMTKQHNEKHAYFGFSRTYLADLKLPCKNRPHHWIRITELPKNDCQIISIRHRHLQASSEPLSRFACNPVQLMH
jgi:hypothetical protein